MKKYSKSSTSLLWVIMTLSMILNSCSSNDNNIEPEIPTPKKVTLTYNINGATSGASPTSITENEGTTVILNNGTGFSRTGYMFSGWNTNANGTGTDYSAGNNYNLSNDATLYAKWIPEEATQYTLIYNINGATNGSTPTSITANAGMTITLNNGNGLSRTGYTFVGWNSSTDGTGTDYSAGSNYTLNRDVTLYAKWSQTQNNNRLKITVGSNTFTTTLASNPTATAFKALLPMTINMSELNNNEKYYNLSNALPSNSSNPRTIQNGDLMLYGSSTLVLFYKTFNTSYSYTRIGKIDNPSGLENALGRGNATVIFELD